MLVEGRLLRRLGHLNPEYPAFSEWDLVLRASRLLKISQIGHVPAVLHHLVAREHGELAEARAVRESFLAEEGRVLRWVSSGSTGFELPAFEVVGAPRVAVIVPTRDSLDDLRTCIESLGKTHYENHEVVVVDNQSGDPATLDYLEFLAARPGCRVIRYPFAFSYAALHNFVVEQVEADYICLLNNDTEITDPDWLATMLGYAQRDGTGAVGVKLVYPSGGIQHAGVVLGPGGLVAHVHRLLDEDAGGYMNRAQLVQNYSVVTAACMLVSKANWERVGGMCEQLPIAYNDVDFCLRLVEAGLRNVYLPQVKVIHYESKSRGPDAATHGRRYWSMQESGYLQWRWGHLIKHDPAYNANLSLYDEHFRLAEPRVGPPWSWKFAWLNVPGGFHPIRDGILSVLPNETVHFACLLPGRFSGTIGALRLPVDIIVGAVDGIVILEVELDGSRVASVRPLNRISRQTVVTFEFDDHEVLETSHGGTLHCTLTLVKARFPIALPTYPATEEWSHQLEGLPNHALHIEVGVRPPVDLIA
jgi:GT2 family glycosyltransferase